MRLNAVVAALVFLFYSALTGLTISSIFLVYDQAQIAHVFWITAGTFFVTSLFGLLFKRDLSASGNVLFMLLLGWTIAWTFSWLFRLSDVNWLLTFVGIALFVGLTAYDTQRLKKLGALLGSHPAGGALAVLASITRQLYVAGDVVAGLEMPVLAEFLADPGEWPREIAVDTVLRFGASRTLSDALAKTGLDVQSLGEGEVAEGL